MNTQHWMSVTDAAEYLGINRTTLFQRKCLYKNATYFKKEGKSVYVDVANFPTTSQKERAAMEALYFELLELLDNRAGQVAVYVAKKLGVTTSCVYMYFDSFKFKERDTYVKYYAAMQEVLNELSNV